MNTEHDPERPGEEDYCINCGRLIQTSGNPYAPGAWMCEECKALMLALRMDSPQR